MLNNKLFLKGLSIIRAFPLGIMLAPGAGVVSFVARVKEKPEISVTSTDGNLNFPIFNFPDRGSQQVTIQVAAVDSRGRQSEWVERTIDVMYYQSPSIGAMILDFASGTLAAWVNPDIEFKSKIGINGIIRKIASIVLLVFFIPVSALIPAEIGAATLYTLYLGYLGMEVRSVFENYKKFGFETGPLQTIVNQLLGKKGDE